MKAPERLETARLVLRRPARGDVDGIFARYASDPEVTRYLAWPRHTSIEDTQAFLDFSDSQWTGGPAGPYLIEARESGALLGSTGLTFGTADEAETGYVLARDAWGKGYATEALSGILRLSRQIALRRVTAKCHVDHAVSRRVLEKCGFVRQPDCSPSDFPNLDASGPQLTVCYARTF